jgi:hypothetical protein
MAPKKKKSGQTHAATKLLQNTRPVAMSEGVETSGMRGLDRMASFGLEAACLLGIVDYVASHAEPHVEHEGINRETEAGHGS